MYVKKSSGFFPIMNKFVVRTDTSDWLDSFHGSILECYNTLPWGSDSMFVGGRIWGTRYYKMIVAYRNLQLTSVEVDPGPPPFYYTEADTFGLMSQLTTIEGENTNGGPGSTPEEEFGAAGGYGVMVSSYWDVWVQGTYSQPISRVESNSPGVITMETTGYAPGVDIHPHLGFLWDLAIGEAIAREYRDRDMVFWLYLVDMHGGLQGDFDGYYNLIESYPAASLYIDPGEYYPPMAEHMGIIMDDGLFKPGSTGYRLISNQFKNAPWERYPNL
jgi:hypothetical protein